jgi:hypothetical protein
LSEYQPQSLASDSGTSKAISQAESSTAGSQLIRPGTRGDSGTNTNAAIADRPAMIIGSQNSQW